MRTITLLIIHCSATPQGVGLSFEDCRRDHIRHRGFSDIGYHFYVTRDGEIHRGRPPEKVGAHCLNHNRHSIGICYEGGLDADSQPSDTRTLEQKASLLALLRELKRIFPHALIVGHHDLNPMKPCPCFNAEREYRGCKMKYGKKIQSVFFQQLKSAPTNNKISDVQILFCIMNIVPVIPLLSLSLLICKIIQYEF